MTLVAPSRTNRLLAAFCAAAIAIGLSSCGGSGGGTPSPSPTTFTVTASAGSGGSISPSSATVSSGGTTAFTVTANKGYSISSVSGCGGTLSGNTYTTGPVSADCTVTATFAATASYTATATAGTGGSITPSSATVASGSTTSFTVTPDAGYTIGAVTGCGGTLSGSTYATGPIAADCTVTATFTPPSSFTVTAAAGTGGNISPSTAKVTPGNSASFIVTPDTGYLISGMTGCGRTLTGSTYTTGAITADCTVTATFEANPAANQWTWQGGSNLVGALGVYGTRGVAAPGNVPGARDLAVAWTDASGNRWLFGGEGDDVSGVTGDLNDLWEYQPSTSEWTWVAGANIVNTSGTYGALGTPSSSNAPGARNAAATWTDAHGNLWLLGGYGYDAQGGQGELNDLWKFDPSTSQWTWVGGSDTVNVSGVYGTMGTADASNKPGSRAGAVTWTDAKGDLWLFGGYGYDVNGNLNLLNDLWKYDPSTSEWTWEGGANTIEAPGTYGTMGTAAAGNQPGARTEAAVWTDAKGDLWLFGGQGYNDIQHYGYLSDVWMYDPSTSEWTWEAGSTSTNTAPVFGALGQPGVENGPGGRAETSVWQDASGNVWLFGGQGYSGLFSDLWMYSASTSEWTWEGGPKGNYQLGVYGTLGAPASGNIPGGRYGAVAWTDAQGNFWLFGGWGIDSFLGQSYLNDLWEYQP